MGKIINLNSPRMDYWCYHPWDRTKGSPGQVVDFRNLFANRFELEQKLEENPHTRDIAKELRMVMPGKEWVDIIWKNMRRVSLFGGILPGYMEISDFRHGRAIVRRHGEYGFMRLNGKLLTPIRFDAVDHFQEGFAAVSNYGKWGFIRLDGSFLAPYRYAFTLGFKDGRARIETWEHQGYLYPDGTEEVTRYVRIPNWMLPHYGQ